jgi:DNA-binding NarL/FixJ family response regulator
MVQQHSNQEIAQSLSLSSVTLLNYTSNIFARFLVADRAEAIIRALDLSASAGRS